MTPITFNRALYPFNCHMLTYQASGKPGKCRAVTTKLCMQGNGNCPFFKTTKEYEQSREKAKNRLLAMKRLDLIERYGGDE